MSNPTTMTAVHPQAATVRHAFGVFAGGILTFDRQVRERARGAG